MMPFAAMRLAPSPVAAPSGGPAPLSVTDTQYLTTGTTRAVTMPATVAAGDLLVIDVMFRSTSGVTSVTPPPGWGVLSDVIRTGNVFRKVVCYKIADGTEGGTSATFNVVNAANMAASVFRFGVGTFSGIPYGTGTHGNSVSPTSPLLAPPYGSWPYTWVATAGINSSNIFTAYPLPSGQGTISNSSNNTIGRSYTQSTAASLTPGAFTITTARDWVAHTWAVPGPGLPTIDSLAANVVSLGRGLGADGSTTITDDTGRVLTRYGTGIEIDTAQSIFGGSSIYFPGGSGNYLDTPDTADLTLGANYWTLEVWIRPADVVGDKTIMGQWDATAAARAWVLYMTNSAVNFAYHAGGTASIGVGNVAANAWKKITLDMFDDAGTRKLRVWQDQTQGTTTNFSAATINDATVPLGVGGRGPDPNTFKGHLVWRLTVGASRYNGGTPAMTPFLPLT